MAGGPNSAFYQSIRTKKAIISVCKRWWQVGLEILYEDVVFHHIGQIPALVRTLEAHSKLGKLVKKLTVRCFVPSGYIRLFEEQLRRVFGYCPFATRIFYSPLHSFNPPFPLSFEETLYIPTSKAHSHCMWDSCAFRQTCRSIGIMQDADMVILSTLNIWLIA